MPTSSQFPAELFNRYGTGIDLDQKVRYTEGMTFLNRWILELCRPYLGHDLLEIGPGTGALLEQLIEHYPFRAYTAIDLHGPTVTWFRQRYAERQNITILEGDFMDPTHFPNRARDFDTIISISCLEHIPDDVAAVQGMKQLLRPQGKIVLYLPAMQSLFNIGDHLVGHYRRYDKSMLRELAEKSGLTLHAMRYCNLPGILSWMRNARAQKTQPFFEAVVPSPWLVPWISAYLRLENHMPLPIGLNMFCVLTPK
ncbi:MAG: methyltransferase domain-containing protein [Magnetococcales bacterium]|nr:methyltransferase domain-containing protein [Magnetococcales bacterium]